MEEKEKEPAISGFSYFYFLSVEGMRKKRVKEGQKSVEVVKKDINYGNNKEYYFGFWIEQNDGKEYMWSTLASNMLRIHSQCQKIWE